MARGIGREFCLRGNIRIRDGARTLLSSRFEFPTLRVSCQLAEIAAQTKEALAHNATRGGAANLMPKRNYDGEIQMNTFETSIGSFTIKATGPLGVLVALAALALVFYLSA